MTLGTIRERGRGLLLFLIAFRSHCLCNHLNKFKHSMPEISFNFIQLNFVCCSRRRRHSNHDSETTSNRASEPAFDRLSTDISDTFSDFEIVQSRPGANPTLSRAKLRWVRATLAAILRQRVVKAFSQLTRRTKHNKSIGAPDPAVSRLWGQTGNWLKKHKL